MIGETIKEMRIARGWTQEYLASVCGYSHRSAIARIEKCERDVDTDKVVVFAKAFGVDPMVLLGEPGLEGDVIEIMKDMSQDHKRMLLTYARYLKGTEDEAT